MTVFTDLRSKCAEAPLKELVAEAENISRQNFGKKIELFYSYYQDETQKAQITKDAKERYKEGFIDKLKGTLNKPPPLISLSGHRCELNCKHCRTITLRAMHFANTPEKLHEAIEYYCSKGSRGFLLSGGSGKDGATLIEEGFDEVIKQLKKQYNIYLGIHTGYVTRDRIKKIKDLGVDAISIDVIGDQDTLTNIYHIDRPISIIEDVVRFTVEEEIDLVPHLLIGLNFCKIVGEYDAIDMLSKYPIKYLTYLILEPLPLTPMADLNPPKIEEVVRLMAYARMRLPRVIHSLGCMRPVGRYGEEMENYAIKLGCNRLASISSDLTIDTCKKLGLDIKIDSVCCMLGINMFSP